MTLTIYERAIEEERAAWNALADEDFEGFALHASRSAELHDLLRDGQQPFRTLIHEAQQVVMPLPF